MECREVRELLDSFLSEQLLVETTHEIVRHLESCPVCRAELEARRAMRTAVRSAIRNAAELAPEPAFVDRLSARLRREAVSRQSAQARWATWLAAAAGVLIATSIGIVLATWMRDRAAQRHLAAVAAAAAGDHLNCAVRFRLAEAPIPLEEAARRYGAWYRRMSEAGGPGGGGIDVVERHSCVFGGRRFAHVVLRYRGRIVSLLVTEDSGAAVRGNAAAGDAPVVSILEPIAGVSLASFRVPGYLAFVASDSDGDSASAVARVLAAPVARLLSGGTASTSSGPHLLATAVQEGLVACPR